MKSGIKKFTGYYDKNGKKIYTGDVVQWGETEKFYVFYAPHTNSKWGIVNGDKLTYWDGRTADYFLSTFDDDNNKKLEALEII